MSEFEWIPWPPSANRYWRTWRNRAVVSAEAKAYKQDVRCRLFGRGDVTLEPVGVRLLCEPPDKRRRDLDNCLKVTLDALEGVLYENDRQVVEIEARMLAPATDGQGGVWVQVMGLGHV